MYTTNIIYTMPQFEDVLLRSKKKKAIEKFIVFIYNAQGANRDWNIMNITTVWPKTEKTTTR